MCPPFWKTRDKNTQKYADAGHFICTGEIRHPQTILHPPHEAKIPYLLLIRLADMTLWVCVNDMYIIYNKIPLFSPSFSTCRCQDLQDRHNFREVDFSTNHPRIFYERMT